MFTVTTTYRKTPNFYGDGYTKKRVSRNIRNDYSPFGAPLPGRTYQQGKFDAKVVNLVQGSVSTTGWTTIFCTNPTTCTSPETAVTLTATGGKLRMQTNKRYAQAYYTFTTVPGRVYKVKYRLSGVTFGLTNTSVFAPINRTELYTSANLQSSAINGVDREVIFTATEASTRFYITRGWAPNATTPTVEEVSLDYLNITEVPSQVNTISCTSINENMVMLANSGVVMTNFTAVANALNAYYNRNYTYAEYQAILSHCTGLPASYVLAAAGAEAASVKASYTRGFNGMEKDDDTYGEGNAYDFGARIYDSRLGRWLAVEPLQKKYPGLSTYCYANNNPILFLDVDGKDWFVNNKTGTVIYIAKASKVSAEQISKMGTGGNPNDYERLGPNDMFGKKVKMGNGVDVLKMEAAIIEASEDFMKEKGYAKAERVNIVEKSSIVTVGDDVASLPTIHQKGDAKITYVKPERLNVRENEDEEKYQDENVNLTTITYTVNKTPGQKIGETAIFPQNRPSSDSIWNLLKQAVTMAVESYFDKKSSRGGRAPSQPAPQKAAGK